MSYLDELSALGLSKAQIDQLQRFCALLLAWRKTHNVTGVRTHEQCMEYVVDSLLPLSWLSPFTSLLDIGSGGGFPALPLAIARPEASALLVEPIAKKASFLTLTAIELGLTNVRVVAKRIEEITPFPCDLITSRAVAKTDTILQLAAPFRTKETTILLYKGSSVDEETPFEERARIIKQGSRSYLIIEGEDRVS
ncbi:MAG: 16S rRNA (guanine(527)-N(7))-methyltransferase RsmG [Campylobacterales bacterium]